MTAKTRKALLYIFMSLFILTMFTASLTFGRYSAEQSSDSHYSGDFEYVLSDAIVVNSIDEFFDAINNGYSNIQIGDEVDNPLIITGDTGNVWADLTIDLNGHELQRNDRDPLLNVSEGFRLTIIDSKGGGSLYNPVGSVLRSSGGTITVTDGIMESGPRNGNRVDEKVSDVESDITNQTELDEYANNSNGFDSATGGAFSGTGTVTYYTNNNGSSYTEDPATMPIIIPTQITRQWTTDGQTITQNALNGNMYLEGRYTPEGTKYFDSDTYLYYTIEGTGVSNEGIAASTTSADFYYTYYVNSSNYGYVSSAPQDDALLVTVYGYNGVKAGSQNSAAIEATGGEVLVRGGAYYSYFGEENTYCINANSGYMSVDSSSAISFYAYGNGVCVNCDFTGSTRTGDADLRITNGNFYSELGNTISVSNGVMKIGTATFTKDAGTTSANSHTENGSVISVEGGRIEITSSATFNITGSGIDGIHAEATSFDANASALVDVESITMTFNSDTSSAHRYNRGIYSKNGAISCKGTTNVTLNGGSGSTDNFGIYTLSGQITVNGDTTVSVSGEDSNGVYSTVEKGTTAGAGRISITGDTFTCTVKMNNAANLSSTAISTAGGNISFNVGSAVIDSDGLGITALNMLINSETGNPDASTAIQGAGNITFESNIVTGATNTIDLDTLRGTGVYIYGGGVTIAEGVTLDVTSTIQNLPWQGETGNPTSYDGIYIQSGSLDSQGTLNVTHTGVQNDNIGEGENSGLYDIDSQTYVGYYEDTSTAGNDINAFKEFVIKSYAVRVEGDANVTIIQGNIRNSVGGGLYVEGSGIINLGQSGKNLSISAKGTEHYTGFEDDDGNIIKEFQKYYYRQTGTSWGQPVYSWVLDGTEVIAVAGQDANSNWGYLVPKTGGHAVQIVGGTVNIYNGQYSAEQGNGLLVEGGDVTITDGEFKGNDNYEGTIPGAGASYAFKLYGGTVTVNGGTFGVVDINNNGQIEVTERSSGSGVFVMGDSLNQKATVNMYGGTIDVDGTSGVSVWTNVTATFGEANENGTPVGNGPSVRAESTGLAIESTNSDSGTSVTINVGSFTGYSTSGGKDGIWYGEGTTQLIIKSGTFTGNGRSGLYFSETPNSGNVQLSGGTYNSPQNIVTRPDWGGYSNVVSSNAIDCSSDININYAYILANNAIADLVASGTRDGNYEEHLSSTNNNRSLSLSTNYTDNPYIQLVYRRYYFYYNKITITST